MTRYKQSLVEFELSKPIFYKRLYRPGYYCWTFRFLKEVISSHLNRPFLLDLDIIQFCDYVSAYFEFIDIKDFIVQKKIWR